MPESPRARFLLAASVLFLAIPQCICSGEPANRVGQAPSKPASAAPSQLPQAKNPSAEPAAPVSTHFPILLLVVGKDLSWSLRIGQKGPERYDRNGYPPIPLDPGPVIPEAHTDAWTYNAKDMQTGAAVTIHLSRVPCTDNSTATKYGFTASVDHAQIGSADGCARIATDLFPRINNQLNDDSDDSTEDSADNKDKPVPTTVTRFTPPSAVAYVTDTGRMVVKRGSYTRAVAGAAGHDLCLSHDGKKLLFVRDEEASPLRTLDEFDFETRKITELAKANLRQPFWSPDDSRIAFLENANNKWQVWIMPADAPDKAVSLATSDITTLDGWTDPHTLLTDDLQSLSWIGDDGTVRQTLSSSLLYGKDQFGLSSANTVRVHPSNPDLLLVSAELTAPLPPPPVPDPNRKDVPKTDASHPGTAFFLYEIRSRRRMFLSPPNLTSSLAEWSRDGLQIFFTGSATSSSAPAIYRLFWDGASQIKIHDGRDYVIGQ
ncbi:MAG TPA: hypothetical protein VJN93_02360 [Candidatus Acidoferrum sp.]|nr:hypothetical protein [Candidatus Acidoferrum sp.]